MAKTKIKVGFAGTPKIAFDIFSEILSSKDISGSKVKYFSDYLNSSKTNLAKNTKTKINLPTSNVIEFETAEGYKLILRPSGTEPKIKMYISVNRKLKSLEKFNKVNLYLDKKLEDIINNISL